MAPLELEIVEEFLGEHSNVSVILEAKLAQKDNNYDDLFNASFIVVPQKNVMEVAQHRVSVINGTHTELKVMYNTRYNVSRVGNICGRNTESLTIQLLYIQ